jgi:hypothetical protein
MLIQWTRQPLQLLLAFCECKVVSLWELDSADLETQFQHLNNRLVRSLFYVESAYEDRS